MLFGQCPNRGGDLLKGASLTGLCKNTHFGVVWFVEEGYNTGSGSVHSLELDYCVLSKIGRQSSSLTSTSIHEVMGWIHTTQRNTYSGSSILNVRDLGINYCWSTLFSINL